MKSPHDKYVAKEKPEEGEYRIDIDDLYKIHGKEIFKDTYLIFASHTLNKVIDVQKMLLRKKEIYLLYQKLEKILRED